MNYTVLNVDTTNDNGYKPTMTLYLPDNSSEIDDHRLRPTVVILPGGAYACTSDREAEPVALKFAAADLNAVVVRYSCAPARFPTALLEVAFVVAKLRENAKEWNVDENRIIVCGFSAGGHLAACYGNLWNKDLVKEYFGFEKGENRPNGMILSYPVITSGEKAHRFSFECLLGDKVDDADMLRQVSMEKQINEHTPPAFIWHTFTDDCVPVENSLLMATALREKNISTELHIFPEGPHGLSLANTAVFGNGGEQFKTCACWADMAIRWIKDI